MKPTLSVIMPVYNGEKYIAVALESVREQKCDGIELVVVDDGSTDRTLDIVRSFARDLPIRIITPGRIGNWVAVSNIGLREAAGEWACFLHQDDFWLPGRMVRMRREIESAEGALILHNAMFVGPEGQNLGPWTCPIKEGSVLPKLFLKHLLVQNFIAIPSPLFRRAAALQSGGMDETLWFSADWDLWLRLGALGPVRFVNEALSAFRVHPESQTLARKLKPGEWTQQLTTVLDRHLHRAPFTEKELASTARAAEVSIAVNSALAAASHGEPARPFSVILKLLSLGPWGLHNYLRDCRIIQRVSSRLKARRLTESC